MVKEVEDPAAPRLVVALDLAGGGLAGELAAGRAAWYAYEALGRGYDVVLATVEPGGAVTARVGPPTDVNQRLARIEQVKRFEVLPVEWTAESEELTPTLKLRRRIIHAKYAEHIDALYQS